MIMRHNYRKKYKNVVIRQLDNKDLEFLRTWRNNPANTKFLRKIPYITTEMQSKWFALYLEDNTEMVFAIDEVDILHQVVGSMALYNIENTCAEVGKILVGEPKAHGLNVCVNALKALMELARDRLELKALYLHVYKDNIPANIVYRRAGFEIDSEHIASNGMIEYKMSIKL